MPKRGKKYRAACQEVEAGRLYPSKEAVKLAKKTAVTNFDSTVELHVRVGVDPRQAEQQVRSSVVLPHGLGKDVRVLVFAEGDDARAAEQAGADYIADEDVVKRIQYGWTDFDVVLAVPELMGKVGRLGRTLGPRGLMPNPKAGTVAPGEDLPRLIGEAKAGRISFRLDKYANLHVPIGKASFSDQDLYENLTALMDAVRRARPPSAKGSFFQRVTLATTMGPGIRVDPNEVVTLD